MPTWAWPALLCALAYSNHVWMKLLLNSPPMPNPTVKPLPTEDFLLTLWWLLPSMLESCGGQNHRIQKQKNRDGLVSVFLPGIWHITHTTALRFPDYGKPFVSQNSLMTLSTNFPRRSSVTPQEKWSPATTQRFSSVSLVMEATVATLPFLYTARCTKVTQVFKPNVSWGRGKRETRGMTPLGASGQW